MKIALLFLAVALSYATARFPKPCGGLENIKSCVCGDEESTEVTNPRDCRGKVRPFWLGLSCVCADDTEWEAPEPPCGGKENIAGCAENEESGEA